MTPFDNFLYKIFNFSRMYMTTQKYCKTKRSYCRRNTRGGGNCVSSGSCYIPDEQTSLNTEHMTPTQKLVYAVERDDLDKVKEAISEGANINGDVSSSAHQTPLLSAIYNDNVDIVKYLLSQKNTDINVKRLAPNFYNPSTQALVTPILLATQYHRKAIIDVLLRHGAKIDQGNFILKYSPLIANLQQQIQSEKEIAPEISAKKKMFPGFSEMTRAYVAAVPDSASKRVFSAIQKNNLNVVKNVIEAQIENKGVTDPILRNKQFDDFIVSRDSNGNTFLIAAVKAGNISIIKYLLELLNRNIITTVNNTYLNGVNNDSETAIMVAAALGYTDIVNILFGIDNINLDKRDLEGFSLLDKAIDAGNIDFVKKLVDKGVHFYNRDREQFPFAIAQARRPHVPIEIFQYLLKQGPARTGLTDEYVHWMLNSYSNSDMSAEKRALLEQYAKNYGLNNSARIPPRAGGKMRSKKRRDNKKIVRKTARHRRK